MVVSHCACPYSQSVALFSSGCTNERAAAAVLGYTPFSWDNFSGKEPQPASADKNWSELTDKEKAAAKVLGYTGKIWDNEADFEPQSASVHAYWPAFYKFWLELTSCGNFGSILVFCALTFTIMLCFVSVQNAIGDFVCDSNH